MSDPNDTPLQDGGIAELQDEEAAAGLADRPEMDPSSGPAPESVDLSAATPDDLEPEASDDMVEETPGDAGENAAAVEAASHAERPGREHAGGAQAGDARTDGEPGVEQEPIEEPVADARPTAEIKAILEALIFASPEPLTPKAMFKLLASEPKEDVQAALAELKADYERPGGLQLVEVAGGFQIVTRPDLHEWVRRLFHERTTQKLSVQALETLAVIAYKQPITALEVAEIRGVNTSGVMNTLLERHLIKIVGRKKVIGRPFLYATTKDFLIRFGLNELTDLPKVEDMAEALGIEAPLLVERTPEESLLPLDEPGEEEREGLADEAE